MIPVSDFDHGSEDTMIKYTKRNGVDFHSGNPVTYRRNQMDKTPSLYDIYSASKGKSKNLENIMKEFRQNGSDLPYNPDDDNSFRQDGELAGVGPSSGYLRQMSWPEPERTPVTPLRRWKPSPNAPEFIPSSHKLTVNATEAIQANRAGALTAEQLHVLNSLPDDVLGALLHVIHVERGGCSRGRKRVECRFCKSNGETDSFYRSHTLKNEYGVLTCPVLRAHVCCRCGATGNYAHTLKYCPLTTREERIRSDAMIRNQRNFHATRARYGYPSFNQSSEKPYAQTAPPLDPLWAALERKLIL